VFVEAVTPESFPELPAVAASIQAGEPVALATVLAGPGHHGAHLAIWGDRIAGTLGSARLDAAVVDDARGMLEQGTTGERRYGPDGERRLDDLAVFVAAYAPPPTMYVFGAIDFAAAVARVGVFLGYRVTVCDARAVFATSKRFPDAHEVVIDWPHRFLERAPVDGRTVICVLTHDPKFDVPLLQVALRTPAAYIGAMGSRRTNDERTAQLRAAGVSDADLARIAAPIGLDIGARTPEETAISIAAELVALRWGGSGQRLVETEGPIHHPRTGS
jgi:xanthine dehydrogenase accessory factor